LCDGAQVIGFLEGQYPGERDKETERYRGKRNEPAYVVETAKTLADTRAVSLEEIARQTTENFFHLFRKVPGREASADTSTLSAPA
jgi:hypothetical protein